VKYVIIGIIAAAVFVIVYTRVRPYLLLIRKVVNSLNVSTSFGTTTPTSQAGANENKLVRCAGCGTWVPENRALNLRRSIYCSPECMEKKSEQKERKLAG
jgi:hypothetical protein